MTTYYFGSASFTALITNPGITDRAEITELHIPGSSSNYIDIGGRLPSQVELALFFPVESNYTTLRSLVGTSASLTYPGGSSASAVLESLQRTYRGPNGQSIITATFIVT